MPAIDEVVSARVPVWRKSSYSTEQEFGTCVEVAEIGDEMGVRDSKNPDGGYLSFSREAWAGFVSAVRSGAV